VLKAFGRRVLANIYLHCVFDLWADRWRKRHARGQVIIARYADGIVMGFEHKVKPDASLQRCASPHETEKIVRRKRERIVPPLNAQRASSMATSVILSS
jgi:hypothetical protein